MLSLVLAAALHTFSIGETEFLLDGKPFQVRCGEMHFARIPKPYWRHRIRMCRAMGLNAVCAYLFWNNHEQTPGVFDFTGERDAAEFCRIAQEEGMWVMLRPGPTSAPSGSSGGSRGGSSTRARRASACGRRIRSSWSRRRAT